MSKEVAVNSHGTNAKFRFTIRDPKEMRHAGFTDRDGANWYFMRNLGFDISFNVTIPKDGSEAWIDVLDENFCQPYDWQSLLEIGEHPVCADIINHRVIALMLELQAYGILGGYEVGDYV